MKSKMLVIIFLIFSMATSFAEQTKIFLVTVGPGDDIYLKWGHFAIIVDYEDKRDLWFDYGNFSFVEKDFVPNFIKGIMWYLKGKKSANFELRKTIQENRDITLQELNLTDEQVDIYIKKLFDEIRPENRYYEYDQYYNNCVSQMSDFLDNLTDGNFYEGTSKLTGKSFRDLSRDYVSSNYLYNTLIMFVLGSKVDYNITEKEAMFLPDYTMRRADEVFIDDGYGGLKPLVKNKIEYNRSIDREPVIFEAKPKIVINLMVGIALALISLLISRFKKFSSIIQTILGLAMGLIGSLLFFMAFFTGHYYIHDNWNLIMINPLSFLIFISGILKLSKRHREFGIKLTRYFIDLTLILILFMIVAKTVGLIYQVNGETIALLLPLFLINSSFKLLFFDQQELQVQQLQVRSRRRRRSRRRLQKRKLRR